MEVNQLQQYFGTWQEFLRSSGNYFHSGDIILKTKCSRFCLLQIQCCPQGGRLEITKDPETGQTITVSRVLLPALKREQHGQELSCEVESTQVENSTTVTYFPLLKVVHPGAQLPLWVKAMLNIGCKSTTTATTHKIVFFNSPP